MADNPTESEKPTKVVGNADPDLFNRFHKLHQSKDDRLASSSNSQPTTETRSDTPPSNPSVPPVNPHGTNDAGSGLGITNPSRMGDNHQPSPTNTPLSLDSTTPVARQDSPTTSGLPSDGPHIRGYNPPESIPNQNAGSQSINRGLDSGLQSGWSTAPLLNQRDNSFPEVSNKFTLQPHQPPSESGGANPDAQAGTRAPSHDYSPMQVNPASDGTAGNNLPDKPGTNYASGSSGAPIGSENPLPTGRNAGSNSPAYEMNNSQDPGRLQIPVPQTEAGHGSFTNSANAGNVSGLPTDKGTPSMSGSSPQSDRNVALMGVNGLAAGPGSLDNKSAGNPSDSKAGPNATGFDAKGAPLSGESNTGIGTGSGIGTGTGLDAKATPLTPGADAKARDAVRLDTKGSSLTAGADSKIPDASRLQSDSKLQADSGFVQTRKDIDARMVDPKLDSGRSDTNQGKLTPPSLDTGRADTNSGASTKAGPAGGLAGLDGKGGAGSIPGLDGKIGTKSDTGSGGGVPIVMPGIPDILGGLKGIAIRNDGKVDNDAANPKGTKSDGTRDSDEAGSRSGASKTPGMQDGRGGKDGVTTEGGKASVGAIGSKDGTSTGARIPADGASSGGKDGLVGADGKASVDGKGSGWKGDVPVLAPGSLPVPDIAGGLKNLGERLGFDPKGSKTDKEPGVQSDAGKAAGVTDRTGKGDASADGKGTQPGGKAALDGKAAVDGNAPGDGKAPVDGKGSGKGDIPILHPVSVPVPDIAAGLKNLGERLGFDPKGKGTTSDGPTTVVTGGAKGSDGPRTVVTGGAKSTEGPSTVVTGVKGSDGPKTVVTGGAKGSDGPSTVVTGGAKGSDGPSTVVTGGARGDVGTPSLQDGRTGKDGVKGDKNIGLPGISVPLDAVPLKFLAGNLKAIAERIFPVQKSQQENTGGRRLPDFEASLPGRQTVRLDAIKNPTEAKRAADLPDSKRIADPSDAKRATDLTDARRTPAIPIDRSMGPVTQRLDGQFMIKTGDMLRKAQPADVTSKAQPADVTSKAQTSDAARKVPASDLIPRVVPSDKPGSKRELAQHAASEEDRLLANFELVLEESGSKPTDEENEEADAPQAPPLEFFEREDVILPEDEEEVQFDGPVTQDDERAPRYQYTVEPGDTVELVATKALKDVSLAPLIYQINKDSIAIEMKNGQLVFALKPGTTIWLPFPREIAAFQQQNGIKDIE